MWKKYGTAGQATDGNIIRRMRFACWLRKVPPHTHTHTHTHIHTHSAYVTLIAFQQQQRSRERASPLL
jgi:hypothetical protein